MNSVSVTRRRSLRPTLASALLAATLPMVGVLATATSASALTTTTISVGGNPGPIASNGSYVWLAKGGTLTQLNASTGAVLQSGVAGGGSVDQLAIDATSLWADNQGASTITQLNAATGAIVRTIAGVSAHEMVSDGTSLWVAPYCSGTIKKIDIATQQITTLTVPGCEVSLAVDATHVWVSALNVNNVQFGPGQVSEVSKATGAVLKTFTVGPWDHGIASDGTTVWVSQGNNTLSEINAVTGTLISSTLPGSPTQSFAGNVNTMVDDGAHFWVLDYTGAVSEFSASTGAFVADIPVGGNPQKIALDTKHLWVSNANDGTVSEISLPAPATASSTPTISNLPQSAAYGGSFTPVVATNGDGAKSVTSSTSGVCTVAAGVVHFVGVGSCSLTAAVDQGATHQAATGNAQSFTVSKATLTVTAANASFNYHGVVPALSYTLSGFVSPSDGTNGSTTGSAVSAAPTCRTLATSSSNAGSYPSICSGGTSTLYTFAYVNGTVTVNQLASSTPVLTNVLTGNEDTIDNQFYPVVSTTGDGVTSVTSTTPLVCNVDPLADIVVYAATGTCTLVPQVTAGTNYAANTNGTPYSFTVVDAATSGTVTYAERDWWNGGYNASLTISNPTGANIGSPSAPWSLTFALPAGTTIASFSGASYAVAPAPAPSTDQVVTVTGLNSDAIIPANGSVTVSFTTNGTGAISNCSMGGVACSSSPDAVVLGGVTQGDGSAIIKWTVPGSVGAGAASYIVSTVNSWQTCTTTTHYCTMTGLTNGTSYSFVVRAVDANGVSSSVSAVSNAVTPVGTPSTMNAPSVSLSGTTATLHWTAPSDLGGAALAGYTVTSNATLPGACVKTLNLSCTLTGLTNGTTYTFRVAATNVGSPNSAGSAAAVPLTGAASPASMAVTPFGAPDVATAVTASATSSQHVTVSWTAPVSLGGSSLKGYKVTAAPGGLTCWVTTTSCVFADLTNGTTYTFTVKTISSAGYSSVSAASSAATPSTVRNAPRWVHAVAGHESAVVSWLAPLPGGGSPLTGYLVTASNGGGTCTPVPATATSCTFTGLTDNTAYTFSVVAINANGNSAAAVSAKSTTPQSATLSSALSIGFTKAFSWPGAYQGYYTVKNKTSHVIGGDNLPWSFSFTLPSGTTLSNLWGGPYSVSVAGGVTTVTVVAPQYAPSIAAGKFTTVSFIVAGSASPSNCLAGGSACTP